MEAAHRLKGRFTHGSLFLDLRGMDVDPLSPDRAVRRLLHAFGVDERQVPNDVDDRLSLYRSLLRDRTVLMVLDNAADEAQVRPLLAGGNGSLVVVTSRNTLAGLDARHRVALDRLDTAGALELLSLVVGESRIAAEPEEAKRVAHLCGGVPLALVIAGNRLASRTRWTIAYLADRLADESRRLTVLTAGDLQVRAAFEMSYDQLDADTATMFRRLSLVFGSEVSVELAAVVSGQSTDAAENTLERLTDASLLGGGATCGHYTCHDLLRVFARERLEADESAEDVQAARLRARHWLLAVATRAAMYFDHDRAEVTATVDGPDPVHDRTSAARWLEREQPHWRRAVRAAQGDHERVLALATAMHWYSDLRGDGELWREVFSAGADAARALGDVRAEAEQANYLSWALFILCGQPHEALKVHHRALAAATEAGDLVLEAWAYYYRSGIESRMVAPEAAVRYNRRAVELFERAGYVNGQFLALSLLGKRLHTLGEFSEAVVLHRRCVAHYRGEVASPGNDELLSMALARSAESLAALPDIPAALADLDEAEELFGRHGATLGLARVHHIRGLALARAGRLPEATEQLYSALQLLADNRWSDDRISILERLAELHDQQNEPARARELRVRAVAECARYDTPAFRKIAHELTIKVSDTKTSLDTE